ncbi:MAG: hypothetical protein Q8P90_01190, partial [bacterium]|nr:hypothetical protein [bacterium]
MKKQCKKCSIEFNISNKDKEFYTKISAPEPSMCPDCRMQKRMAYRNERVLYPSTCGMCKKSMLSMYKEEDGFLVYCLDCW